MHPRGARSAGEKDLELDPPLLNGFPERRGKMHWGRWGSFSLSPLAVCFSCTQEAFEGWTKNKTPLLKFVPYTQANKILQATYSILYYRKKRCLNAVFKPYCKYRTPDADGCANARHQAYGCARQHEALLW